MGNYILNSIYFIGSVVVGMANIKDVAKLSGLGTSTVSRYFNKSGYLSEESKKKIEKACKTLNYKPNVLARAVKTKRSYTICLIVPDISHLFYAELSAAIERACVKRGYKVLLVNASDQEALKIINLTHLHNGFVDGAIITKTFESVNEDVYDVPVVFMEKVRTLNHKYSCVYADDYEGSLLACEYLIRNNCEKILYLCNERGNRREKAYLDTMQKHNLPVCVMTLEELKNRKFREIKKEHYSGVIAWNDYMAAKFIECCHQEDIKIPQDVQLIGYDDVSLACFVYPKLTTIAQPIERLGVYAADTIINQIENKQEEQVQIVLESTLVVRNTTL